MLIACRTDASPAWTCCDVRPPCGLKPRRHASCSSSLPSSWPSATGGLIALNPARRSRRQRLAHRGTSARSMRRCAPPATAPSWKGQGANAARRHLGVRWRRRQHGATIREGRGGAGMPPFGALLTEPEIRAMVYYLRETRATLRCRDVAGHQHAGRTVRTSERHAYRLEIVADGLMTPWGMTFLPDGRLLVSERPGTVRVLDPGKPLTPPMAGPCRCGPCRTAACSTSRSIPLRRQRLGLPGRAGAGAHSDPRSCAERSVTAAGWSNRRSINRPPILRRRQHALRRTLPLRHRGAPVLHHRRSRHDGRRPVAGQPQRRSIASSTTGACHPTTRL